MNLYLVKWEHKDPEDDRKPQLQHVAAMDYSGVEIICSKDMKTQHWILTSIGLVEENIEIEIED